MFLRGFSAEEIRNLHRAGYSIMPGRHALISGNLRLANQPLKLTAEAWAGFLAKAPLSSGSLVITPSFSFQEHSQSRTATRRQSVFERPRMEFRPEAAESALARVCRTA